MGIDHSLSGYYYFLNLFSQLHLLAFVDFAILSQ